MLLGSGHSIGPLDLGGPGCRYGSGEHEARWPPPLFTLRYGGNTSCVELRTRAGTLIVFDCGTGARALGLSLLARGEPISGAMLLGHSHWDHIQGFPFFGPAFAPGNAFTIYAPTGGDKQLSEVLAGQMEYTYFPVRLDQLKAQIDFHDLGEDTFTIGDATVQAQYLNHTALTLGYRVTARWGHRGLRDRPRTQRLQCLDE